MNNKLAAAIAERMGYGFYSVGDGLACWDKQSGQRFTDNFDPEHNIEHAKLIQQKLVDEGWNIIMMANGDGFMYSAWKLGWENITRPISTEPAAIVALAVKVWGIKEGS